MKTIESCKESKNYWIKNWSNLIFVVGILTILYFTYDSLRTATFVSNELTKKTVIYVNNQMVIDRNIKRDTINITVKKLKSDTIIVKEDTTFKDTINEIYK